MWAKSIILLTIGVSFKSLGNALQKSKRAAIIVKPVVHLYISLCLLIIGASKDNIINVIAKGYKNMSTGIDNWMIFSNPKLAITKETRVNTMVYLLYDKDFGNNPLNICAHEVIKPIAVFKQARVTIAANNSWPVNPK